MRRFAFNLKQCFGLDPNVTGWSMTKTQKPKSWRYNFGISGDHNFDITLVDIRHSCNSMIFGDIWWSFFPISRQNWQKSMSPTQPWVIISDFLPSFYTQKSFNMCGAIFQNHFLTHPYCDSAWITTLLARPMSLAVSTFARDPSTNTSCLYYLVINPEWSIAILNNQLDPT